jgi:soluble lytic murein transglycosylase-like protein
MRKEILSSFLRGIILFGFFIGSLNAATFSDEQIETLKLVREVALQYPNSTGETFENTAMAIALTETSAGVFKVGDIGKDPNILKASLGIMQVRLQTARFLADKLEWKEVQEMSDVKLVNKLLGDDKFNVTMAVKYIVWLNEYTKHNYFRTVSRYNGGNYNRPYYSRVMKNMALIRRTIKF